MKTLIIILLLLTMPYIHWLGVGDGFNLGVHLTAHEACVGREKSCESEVLSMCDRLNVRCK
jgi:hypothetical protein